MKNRISSLPFLALFLLLQSCNLGVAGMTPRAGNVQTYAAQTVAAVLGQTAGVLPGTTSEPFTLTATVMPSETPIPTVTLTLTPLPTLTRTPVPCNWAHFIKDVSFPDDSTIGPGMMIEKIWRLQNYGTCTWTSGYSLIFDHGDRMGAPDSVPLTAGTVPPGSTVDATVDLTAPAAPGTYQGYFRLRSSEGQVFGIGTGAGEAFWIKIKVVITVAFQASFSNVHHCGNFYTTTFAIGNGGTVGLESAQIIITNRATSAQIGSTYASDSPFLATADACLPGADGPIGPGSAWFLAINVFPPMIPPPSGLDARAAIRLCTANGLGGTCVDHTVDFTYP